MVKIEENVKLARYTTLGVGGMASYFAAASSKEDLLELLDFASKKKLAVAVIGSGSNILVSDKGFPGLVIVNHARRVSLINNNLTVESGAILTSVVKETKEAGLTGLEWASGIPGTVGGAIVGNAGALGGQIADVLVQAEVYSDGEVSTWHNSDFDFAYRYSKLKGTQGSYVLSAEFLLQALKNTKKLEEGFYIGDGAGEIMAEDKARRSQNYKGKTAGSYFKNPEGFTAAELIDRAGLKGYRVGDAEVSQDHANVFRNCGNATATDVCKLEKYVTKTVKDKFGVTLVPEVVKIGKF